MQHIVKEVRYIAKKDRYIGYAYSSTLLGPIIDTDLIIKCLISFWLKSILLRMPYSLTNNHIYSYYLYNIVKVNSLLNSKKYFYIL